MTNNQILLSNFYETRRSNLAKEAETARANRAKETEDHRANVARETETSQHNRATEKTADYSNVINQAHYERQDAEAIRHNIADEQIRHDLNIINATHYQRMDDEQRRSNLAREKETNRSNIAQESIAQDTNAIRAQQVLNDYRIGQGNLINAQRNTQIKQDLADSQILTDFFNRVETQSNIGLKDQQKETSKRQEQKLKEETKSEMINRYIPWVNQYQQAQGNAIDLLKIMSNLGGLYGKQSSSTTRQIGF